MFENYTRTKFGQFILNIFPSLVLVPFLVMATIPFSTRNAFAVYPTVSGERMLNLRWNPPESGADHYRLEITKSDITSEPAVVSLSNSYTKDNHFQIRLEEGYSYTLRIKGVNSYGLCSDFSEEATFSTYDLENIEKQVTSNNQEPTIFSLSQNQPNPFNPITTISYSLTNNAYVKLFVYNISGQKVTELQNNIMKAGKHSVVWYAHEMPSGIYFYTLITEGFVETKKMILLK